MARHVAGTGRWDRGFVPALALAVALACVVCLSAVLIALAIRPPTHKTTTSDESAPSAPHVGEGVEKPGAQVPPIVLERSGTGRAALPTDVRVHHASPPPPMNPIAASVGEPFEQVGIVYSRDEDKLFPLFARPTPYHRNGRTQYYVGTRDAHVQVSPRVNGRDCAERLGCEELYTGDTVTIPELADGEFTVKLDARP